MTGKEDASGTFDATAAIDRLNAKLDREEPFSLPDLLTLMAILRDPDRGCPWDRAQTFATIAPYTIEEVYEVADAITRGDMDDLKDELGDLLLQIVYHAQMAREAGHFDWADIADAITRKMIRRHPHVFGDEDVRATIEIQGLWDRIKAEEAKAKRGARSAAPDADQSILDDVPPTLPALPQSVKLQKRAAKVGFDWPATAQVLEKIHEELGELEEEIEKAEQEKIEEEFGDLLFVMANLSRRLSVDPETTLRHANAKFRRRFAHIETKLRERGRTLDMADLEEMDALWNEAKLAEKTGR